MYVKKNRTGYDTKFSPLAMYIVSGFCFLLCLCSFPVYAEQEWRILLLPEQPILSHTKKVKVANAVNKELKSHHKSIAYKPFDYGVLQEQSSSNKTYSSSSVSTKPSLFLYHESIEQALASQLISANYEVLDKRLLLQLPSKQTSLESVEPEAVEKQGVEALDTYQYSAKQVELLQNSANLIIRYQFSIQRKATKTIPTWELRLTTVVVDFLSKKQVESHQEVIAVSGMPVGCSASCEQQWFVSHIQKVARDAGAVLVKKLMHLPRRYYYTLRFSAFDLSELYLLQGLLSQQSSKVFSEIYGDDVVSNNLVSDNLANAHPTKDSAFNSNSIDELVFKQSSVNSSESFRQYWYVSLLPSDQLDQLFNTFFLEQAWQVHTKHEAGNVFHFTRKTVTPITLIFYVSVLLLLFVILVVSLLAYLKKHTAVKSKSQQFRLHQQTFDRKASALIETLKTTVKPYEALSLIDEFLSFSSTYSYTHKSDYLPEYVTSHLYKKYENKNRLFHQKLEAIRERYCEKIIPLSGSIIANQSYIYPLNDQTVISLGRFDVNLAKKSQDENRTSMGATFFIPLSYPLLPLIDKKSDGVLLSYQHNSMYVTVNNVNNERVCYLLNNQALLEHVPELLFSKKSTDILSLAAHKKVEDKDIICMNTPCSFTLLQRNHNVLLTLDQTIAQLYDTKKIAKLWPEWSIDLAKKWILQTERLAIGVSHVDGIVLGCFNDEKPLAWLYYEKNVTTGKSHYFIDVVNRVTSTVNQHLLKEQENESTPISENRLKKQQPTLFINGNALYGKVPLEQGAIITFNEEITHQQLLFSTHT